MQINPIAIITHSDLAEKLREHYPHADERTVTEYLAALRGYQLAPTPTTLDRFITAAHMLAIPTIELEA